jgi:hypothetical protein
MDLAVPVNAATASTEALRMQGADRRVLELAAPLKGDHHPAIVEAPHHRGKILHELLAPVGINDRRLMQRCGRTVQRVFTPTKQARAKDPSRERDLSGWGLGSGLLAVCLRFGHVLSKVLRTIGMDHVEKLVAVPACAPGHTAVHGVRHIPDLPAFSPLLAK